MFLQMEDATVHSTDSRARNSEGSSGEVIFVLGGEPERNTFAIELWKTMDMRVPIFVNSPGGGAEQRLKPALDVQMVELSWKAVDTVTNFSTMIPVLLAACVSKVFLVTSDYHMHRVAAVASVMLSGRAIQFVEHVVCSDKHQERVMKIVRDVARAWRWRITGWDLRWIARKLTRPALRGSALARGKTTHLNSSSYSGV